MLNRIYGVGLKCPRKGGCPIISKSGDMNGARRLFGLSVYFVERPREVKGLWLWGTAQEVASVEGGATERWLRLGGRGWWREGGAGEG